MNETGLLSLQLAEVGDAIGFILGGAVFLLGVGIWIHATYFREGE